MAHMLDVSALPARLPHHAAATLLTSGNAVAALHDEGKGTPVFAVAAATAARARAAGCRDVRSADGDAAALAALVRRTVPPPGPLLLLSGQGQGMALAAGLRGAGFRVLRRAVYTARPVRVLPAAAHDALGAGRVHAALFLSADTARGFAGCLPAGLRPALAEVDALAIGEAAAAVLRPLPWRRVLVSGAPTLEGVLALL